VPPAVSSATVPLLFPQKEITIPACITSGIIKTAAAKEKKMEVVIFLVMALMGLNMGGSMSKSRGTSEYQSQYYWLR